MRAIVQADKKLWGLIFVNVNRKLTKPISYGIIQTELISGCKTWIYPAGKRVLLSLIRRKKMRISYRPLWVMLAEREITKKQLRELSGISTASLAKLGKGENLTTDTLLKICKALNCSITEIMETVPDVRQDESICEE
jgi:DNA-binding Xre family transcriptional regulator